jgi:hypothetical protein
MKPALFLVLLAAASSSFAATKPVPAHCDASVNAGMAAFIAQHQGTSKDVDQDNVMLCGTMLIDSYGQNAGRSGHGGHQVLLISAPTSSGTINIELDTNDILDGVVTAHKGDAIYAYGQAYLDPGTHKKRGFTLVAGLHEPHCATHHGADNGWVVVAGQKYPAGVCPVR